jgi:hypothetical protein
MDDIDLIPRLAALDAAPAEEITPAEEARRETMLRTILHDTGTPGRRPARPRPRRRLVLAATGVAAAGLAAAAAPFIVRPLLANGGPLTSDELASWTSAPAALSDAPDHGAGAQRWCLDSTNRGPGAGKPYTISNADQRGKVTSMVVHRAGNTMLCLVGADGAGLWEVIGPFTAAKPDAITLDSGGSHGDGSTGFTYAEGSAGADVTAVTVHDAGRTFAATLENHLWTAWWPTPDPHGAITGTVTLTLTDGTTRTMTGDQLFQR